MQLRIVTWNIFYGKQLPELLKTFKTNKECMMLDIIALQEASIHNNIEDTAVIAKTLGKHYKYYQVTAQKSKGFNQANAVIWNSKTVNVKNMYTVFLPTAKDVNLSKIEKIIRKFLPKEKRNSVVIEGTINSLAFRFYSAHFDQFGFTYKKDQLQALINDNEKREEVDFVCIAGDLNTFKILKRPTWNALQKIAKDYGFVDITSDITWTYQRRSFRYKQKTDAIFLKNVKTFTSKSSNLSGSDHLPIFANVTL